MSSTALPSSPHLWPRLYIEGGFDSRETLILDEAQSHYLRHVLRLDAGDYVRVFHPDSGEFAGHVELQGKKGCSVTFGKMLREPFVATGELHLFFSPLKKERLDFLIEKAVELGVTHLHPVLFQRSMVRDIKVERIKTQMTEAAEQCERLDIPFLAPLCAVKKSFTAWNEEIPVFCALERADYLPLQRSAQECGIERGFLVGPEGGVAPEEVEFLLHQSFVVPVSLGSRILRAETAALFGLSLLQ